MPHISVVSKSYDTGLIPHLILCNSLPNQFLYRLFNTYCSIIKISQVNLLFLCSGTDLLHTIFGGNLNCVKEGFIDNFVSGRLHTCNDIITLHRVQFRSVTYDKYNDKSVILFDTNNSLSTKLGFRYLTSITIKQVTECKLSEGHLKLVLMTLVLMLVHLQSICSSLLITTVH